jgi:hypothetical protein
MVSVSGVLRMSVEAEGRGRSGRDRLPWQLQHFFAVVDCISSNRKVNRYLFLEQVQTHVFYRQVHSLIAGHTKQGRNIHTKLLKTHPESGEIYRKHARALLFFPIITLRCA